MSPKPVRTSDVTAELAQFDDLYQAAGSDANRETGQNEIPDGEYPVVVEQVEFTRSQTSGNNMMAWKFRVCDGAFTGRLVRKYRVINERTIPWLKEELLKCGLKLDRLSELPAHIPNLQGKEMKILKRTKDGNSNVYIQWSGPRPIESEDDLPF